jgi:DNA-binding transcriptional ArsR family regulator
MASPIEHIQQRTTTADSDARVLDVTEDTADAVLDALAAETRREIFRELTTEPATTSELAERLDTSVQNVQYHLGELEGTDLVTEVDTIYSEKGNEMSVYAPASDPLVFVGEEETVSEVRRSLQNLAAGVGAIAFGSLFVHFGAERLLRSVLAPADNLASADRGASELAPAGDLVWLVFELLEPGLVFFLGALALAGLLSLVLGDRSG